VTEGSHKTGEVLAISAEPAKGTAHDLQCGDGGPWTPGGFVVVHSRHGSRDWVFRFRLSPFRREASVGSGGSEEEFQRQLRRARAADLVERIQAASLAAGAE